MIARSCRPVGGAGDGLLASGLSGIFVGPVVLAVSYTLLEAWIGDVPRRLEPNDQA